MEDGAVVIGAYLDPSELEKDLARAQKDLEKFEKEADRLQEKKLFIDIDLEEYYKAVDQLHKDTDKELYLYGATDEDATRILGDEELALAQLDNQYAKQLLKLELINGKIKENTQEQENLNKEIEEMSQQLDQAYSEMEDGSEANLENIQGMEGGFEGVGTAIGGLIKKVIRWGLALLGIRTVLSILTQSFSTLMQYNDDLKQKVEGIKLMLAVAFEPIITWIINLVEKLMGYIARIYYLLTGVDLYSKTMAYNMKKGAGSAKEMKKQLAGFDEMNVLSDNQGSSGGGGGAKIPQGGELPGWLEGILTNLDEFDWLLGILAGIVGFLTLGPEAGALGIAIAGIVLLIQDILDFIKEPTWEKFKTLIDDFLIDIGLIVLGIGALINPWVALAGAVMILVGIIIRYWPAIKDLLVDLWNWIKEKWGQLVEFIKAVYETFKAHVNLVWSFVKGIFISVNNYIASVIAGIIQHFVNLWGKIKDGAKSAVEGVKNIFGSITSFFGGIITKIISFFTSVGQKVGDAIGRAFKSAINGVLKAIESILNTPIRAINGLISAINTLPGVNMKKLSTISLPRLAQGGIVNNPGPGVMMGSYIAGERGPEAVIPLDDQTLDRLGNAFAKHTSINATLINQMNGRVISKELQKVQNESNFAFNR